MKNKKPERIFLEWLNPNNRKIYTWAETKQNIFKLSKKINEKTFRDLGSGSSNLQHQFCR